MIHRWILIAAVIAAFAAITAAGTARGQDATPVVSAEAKETEQDGKKLIQVDVNVEGVTDLGAFEFIMTFTGDVIEVERNERGEYRIERGEFLGSSDREVLCLDPTIEPNALRYTCTTLGDTPRAGAEGEGRLATVFFAVKGDGESNLQFSRARLLTPPGDEMDATWQSGVITVEDESETNWVVYAIIAGAVAAGVVVVVAAFALLQRSRSRPRDTMITTEGE